MSHYLRKICVAIAAFLVVALGIVASGHVRATRDGVVVQDQDVSLDPRVGRYEQRYQVRESQPVLISADGGRP